MGSRTMSGERRVADSALCEYCMATDADRLLMILIDRLIVMEKTSCSSRPASFGGRGLAMDVRPRRSNRNAQFTWTLVSSARKHSASTCSRPFLQR